MHPATLFLALKDAGMTCRTAGGKLLVNPVASLAGELKDQVISHRAALVEWLQAAPEDDARAEAIAQDAADWNPFDRPDVPAPVLVRVNKVGEPAAFVAVDPGYLDAFLAWAADLKRVGAAKAPAGKKKRKAKAADQPTL